MKNWYAIQVYGGFETSVKERIQEESERYGYSDKISQMFSPGDDKKQYDNSALKGYVFIECELDNEIMQKIRSLSKVLSFVGLDDPAPIPQEEIDIMMNRKISEQDLDTKLEIGDNVCILGGDGSISCEGEIEDVRNGGETIVVSVTMFGRRTPVSVSVNQVEKI